MLSFEGQKMPVITVIGQYHIPWVVQGPHYRHRAQFLPDAGVGSAGYKTAAELVQQQLLGAANQVTECVQIFGFEADDGFAIGVIYWKGRGYQIGTHLWTSEYRVK